MTWAMVNYIILQLWFIVQVCHYWDKRIWGIARCMVIIHMVAFLYHVFNSIQ